ncbi:MAG TPA: hypothetical protein VFM93_01165 [Candidatus Limnocylindria bacterium]|nr:hypothetical protein [Candidatus Limnocylindria bacterium]
MSPFKKMLGARLAELGIDLDDEQLGRAVVLVQNATDRPHTLADVTLMTIAVEAYRRPDLHMREVV